MSYDLKISAKDRAAGRFISAVRKSLLRAAFAEKQKSGITQQSIAKKLGVNRSVINRMLKGEASLTLRSVAEIAWALGFEPDFVLRKAGAIKNVATAAGHIVPNAARVMQNNSVLIDGEFNRAIRNIELRTTEAHTRNDNFAPIEVAA